MSREWIRQYFLSTLTLVELKVFFDGRLNKYKPVADPGFDLREGVDFDIF